MKLTTIQIQDLYRFTRVHFVEYYDLQTELVDHLANDIEAIWEDNANLSFEEARAKAFKKFGIYGFSDVVTQRERAMHKRYIKYLFRELKQWFSFPKVMTTVAMFLIFYMVFSTKFSEYFIYAFYGILVLFGLYKSFVLNKKFKQKKKIAKKTWLLEDLIFKQAILFFGFFIYYTINLVNHINAIHQTKYLVILVSGLFSIMCLLAYVSLELLPNKAEILLKETYPEYGISV